MQNRLYLRDLSLRELVARDEEIRQSCSTAQQRLWASVDRALTAPTSIDYHFWALRSAETISGATLAERPSLYRSAAKRIATSYRAERLRKQLLEATLGGRLMAGIAGRLLDKEKPAPRPASIRKGESLAQGRARMLAVGR